MLACGVHNVIYLFVYLLMSLLLVCTYASTFIYLFSVLHCTVLYTLGQAWQGM